MPELLDSFRVPLKGNSVQLLYPDLMLFQDYRNSCNAYIVNIPNVMLSANTLSQISELYVIVSDDHINICSFLTAVKILPLPPVRGNRWVLSRNTETITHKWVWRLCSIYFCNKQFSQMPLQNAHLTCCFAGNVSQ